MKAGQKSRRLQNLAGARRDTAGRPKVCISQSISRVLDGTRKRFACATAIPLGRQLPGASSNLPGRRVQTSTSKSSRLRAKTSCRPYSVLLPVGFAVPPALPPTRCALTAPFHPYRDLRNAPRRSVLCGTFPRLAPAGRYPAPLVHGARTFLPGNLSVLPERPSDRLTEQGWGRTPAPSRGQPGEVAGARGNGSYPRCASSSRKVARVDSSPMPSIRSGRK